MKILIGKEGTMTYLKTHTRYKLSCFILGSCFILSGCLTSNSELKEPEKALDLGAKVTEPIYRDYTEIKRSGVLRVITSYSSNSYFLHRGIQAGFEYELIKNFAEENELALEVIIVGEDENPYDLLNSGVGDVIAANYTITKERREVVSFSRPYNIVDQVLVYSDDVKSVPSSLIELNEVPIAVRRNSSYYVRLMELQDEGALLNIEQVSDEMDTEALLYQVANGVYSATVADNNIYQAASKYMDGLQKGMTIAQNDTIAWALRKNSPDFESKINRYLYKHFRFSEDGTPKRSTFLNVLRKKYFKSGTQIAEYFSPDIKTDKIGSISPYDSLFQQVGKEFGLDWVMLTSIAAQESKFNPNVESWAGALGIMQVLPRSAEIPVDSLLIPELNVREGARILRENLDHYSYLDSTQQWQFALATYNAGQGHVADARRLAIDHNDDPNDWNNLSKSLLRLMQRKYYQSARYGFCRGIETVQYVKEIMNRHNTYEAILALSKNQNRGYPTVLGMKTVN